jgi:multimeric flavodoxin WrbA
MKKIVAIMGSGRKDGNTATIINEIIKGAKDFNAQIKTYNLVDMKIKPCVGCFYCRKNELCFIKDDMQELLKDIKESDAVVIGSPIYMFQVAGQVKQVMDRLYPLLRGIPGKYELGYGIKKTIAVYSQGSPNIDSFKQYIIHNNNSLNLLGLNVIDEIVCIGANDIEAALKNEGLLLKAYEIGKGLAE